jgi:hypothetical protein
VDPVIDTPIDGTATDDTVQDPGPVVLRAARVDGRLVDVSVRAGRIDTIHPHTPGGATRAPAEVDGRRRPAS